MRDIVQLIVEHPWASGIAFLGLLATMSVAAEYTVQIIREIGRARRS